MKKMQIFLKKSNNKEIIMSFWSKLFGGDKETEEKVKDLFNELIKNNQKQTEEKKNAEPEKKVEAKPEPVVEEADGPSGFSWGPKMPAEENQYNYSGTFKQYFDHVLYDDFSQYQIGREESPNGKRVIYTLCDSGRKICVVEIMHSGSASKKLRENCHNSRVGYCRFYYDYEGWWNTREYVNYRINKAINLQI